MKRFFIGLLLLAVGYALALSKGHEFLQIIVYWKIDNPWNLRLFSKLKEIEEKYSDDENVKVDFMFICCEPSSEEAWQQAVEKHHLPGTHYMSTAEADYTGQFNINGYPTVIMADNKGRIIYREVGYDSNIKTFAEDYLFNDDFLDMNMAEKIQRMIGN